MLSGFLKIKSEKMGLAPTPTFQMIFHFEKTEFTFIPNDFSIHKNE